MATLYGGEIEVGFSPKAHRYTVDGKRAPSVTSILKTLNKPALIPWAVNKTIQELEGHLGEQITPQLLEEAKKAHQRAKDEAASLGTRIHDWATGYLVRGDKTLPDDPKVLNGILGLLDWEKTHSVDFTASERVVYSKEHGYVGTLDAEVVIDGQSCVVDFKTSSGIYPFEWGMQLAAYRQAREEEGMTYTGSSKVIRFDKGTGAFQVIDLPDHERDLQAFLGLYTAYKHEKNVSSIWDTKSKK